MSAYLLLHCFTPLFFHVSCSWFHYRHISCPFLPGDRSVMQLEVFTVDEMTIFYLHMAITAGEAAILTAGPEKDKREKKMLLVFCIFRILQFLSGFHAVCPRLGPAIGSVGGSDFPPTRGWALVKKKKIPSCFCEVTHVFFSITAAQRTPCRRSQGRAELR